VGIICGGFKGKAKPPISKTQVLFFKMVTPPIVLEERMKKNDSIIPIVEKYLDIE